MSTVQVTGNPKGTREQGCRTFTGASTGTNECLDRVANREVVNSELGITVMVPSEECSQPMDDIQVSVERGKLAGAGPSTCTSP